ncbi:HAD family hydrolase [Streptomyces sp. NPDC088387]|uniref:HAD family hydrolase n=1 Tax=Streptomyces sp. NPDC088387 TaxID=3365859 RepID=UPI00380A6F0B
MYRAALFDLDGTLIDTEPRSRAAWSRLLARHGVGAGGPSVDDFAGRPPREVLREHLHCFPGHGVEDLIGEVQRYVAGPDMPAAPPVPGALAFVRRLSSAGVPVGVVTSAPREYAVAELRGAGLLGLLDTLVTCDDVRAGKPDPEGYLTGCRTLGAAPHETVVFEDAPAGVTAAKRAGAYCIALTTSMSARSLAHADLVIADLTEATWPLAAAA